MGEICKIVEKKSEEIFSEDVGKYKKKWLKREREERMKLETL